MNMKPIERSEHPYLQVMADIRAQIADGSLAPGDRIPSEREIAEGYKVSRTTAVKVLAALRAEGLVEGKIGIGTIVRTTDMHRSGRDRAATIRRTGRIYAPGEYATITAAEIVAAPDDVATALGLDTGAQVICRRRVTHRADDSPESASTSWFDGTLAGQAPQLLVAERIIEGTWAYLEAQTGRRAVHGAETVEARLATNTDAAELRLTLPAAVKVSTMVLRDTEGSVIEYGVSVAPAGRRSTYEFDL